VIWDGYVSENVVKLVGNWVERVLVFLCRLIAPTWCWPIAKRPGAIVPKVGRNIPCLQLVDVIHY
jgi:hypothetical protein